MHVDSRGIPVLRHVLITGASGFIGHATAISLARYGYSVIGVGRRPIDAIWASRCPDLGSDTDWRTQLDGRNVVVHAAGRAHVLTENLADPLSEFRRVNVKGTLKLAAQAAEMGVRRFVFLSSVGVHGLSTHLDSPFMEDDTPRPHNSYAISKLEAEQGLLDIASATSMEVVIIRPPLVYGPGAPGNFGSLMHWLSRGVPLPLGAIHNRRSLVALDNLVDFIEVCISNPAAANNIFLVSDGDDLSTTELLRRMGKAMGKPARLIGVSPELLRWGAALVRRPEIAQRLCENLQVDISKARTLLQWVPPLSVEAGLKRAAEGYSREASI